MCRESATGTAPILSKKRAPSKKRAVVLTLLPALSGCSGVQSALDPAGPAAGALAELTWVMVAGASAILVLVTLLAGYALYRHPDKRRRISSAVLIVGGGIVLPVAVLGALLVYGVWLAGALRADEDGALHVRVTGHMWWWEVHYPGGAATANEIRIPVGRPVVFSLSSPDVIHSFWVPSLAGKIDMIPGRETRLVLRADRAGRYRGQCAEFCGAQHALMAFHVVALEAGEFERWLARLREPAAAAAQAGAQRGREAFLAAGCGQCHTVRGVAQASLPGPDLTHLAERAWIGAGTLPNTREGLIRWIAEGERVKPGRAMPSYEHLDAATLGALADFLTALD